ncbi:MAG: hypothetical protein KAT04_06170 [Methylococcales bacterium]|nr:hypothetical protein [Methylococcales bacterium]
MKIQIYIATPVDYKSSKDRNNNKLTVSHPKIFAHSDKDVIAKWKKGIKDDYSGVRFYAIECTDKAIASFLEKEGKNWAVYLEKLLESAKVDIDAYISKQ